MTEFEEREANYNRGPTSGETTPPFGRQEAMSPACADSWHAAKKEEEEVVAEGDDAVASHHWKTIANEQAAEVVRLYGCIDAWRDREEDLMAKIAQLKNPEDVISAPAPRSDAAKEFAKLNDLPSEAVESLNSHSLPIMDELRDRVHSPEHYNQGGVECIDAMVSAFGQEAVLLFAKLAAFKYLWRAGRKDNEQEDLEKAAWFTRYAGGDDPREDE